MTTILTIETEGDTIEIPILGNTVVKINDKIVYSPNDILKQKLESKKRRKISSYLDDETYTIIEDAWFS